MWCLNSQRHSLVRILFFRRKHWTFYTTLIIVLSKFCSFYGTFICSRLHILVKYIFFDFFTSNLIKNYNISFFVFFHDFFWNSILYSRSFTLAVSKFYIFICSLFSSRLLFLYLPFFCIPLYPDVCLLTARKKILLIISFISTKKIHSNLQVLQINCPLEIQWYNDKNVENSRIWMQKYETFKSHGIIEIRTNFYRILSFPLSSSQKRQFLLRNIPNIYRIICLSLPCFIVQFVDKMHSGET